jgi:anti-sigma B factor antagonist
VLVVALTLAIAGIMLAARGGQPHGAALASAVCSRPVHAGAGGGLGPVCYRRGPSRRMMLMPVTKFGVETASGVPVVTAPEEIDINNAAGLRTAVLEAAAHGQGTFVVDMSRTQFCDSAGLHVLVGAHKRALAEGGEVRLVIPGPDVLRIFAITGLDHVFPNFSTLEEALAQAPAEGVQGRAL